MTGPSVGDLIVSLGEDLSGLWLPAGLSVQITLLVPVRHGEAALSGNTTGASPEERLLVPGAEGDPISVVTRSVLMSIGASQTRLIELK